MMRSQATMGSLGFFMLLQLLTGVAIGPETVLAADYPGTQDAVIQRPAVTVLEADDSRTVIRIEFNAQTLGADWTQVRDPRWEGIGTWDLDLETDQYVRHDPVYGVHVAVSERHRPQWRIAAIQWHRPPSDPAAAAVTVGVPSIQRSVPLAPVTVYPEAGGGILAAVIVEVRHPAPRELARAEGDLTLVRRAEREQVLSNVANPEHFRQLRVLAMATPAAADKADLPEYFDLTQNWLRLELNKHGMFELTASEMEGWGLTLASIDPTKLRLYRGGGLTLEENPEIPDDEQSDRAGLTEQAILVDDGGDGEWNLGDRIVFYGFGVDIWRDRLEKAAEPTFFYEHPQQATGLYWVTWEDFTTASPLPGSVKRLATVAATPGGGDDITRHTARYHGEQNYIERTGVIRDNWVWDASIDSYISYPAQLEGVIANQPGHWQMDIAYLYTLSLLPSNFVTTGWVNDDNANSVTLNWTPQTQAGAEQVRIEGESTALVNGSNTVSFLYENFSQTGRFMAFDSFDLLYAATLDKSDYSGVIDCVLWGDEIVAPDTPNNLVIPHASGSEVEVWDVSQPDSAFALTGQDAAEALRVGLVRQPGESRYFMIFEDRDLLSVDEGSLATVMPLRQTMAAADYLVIHANEFKAAADQLVAFRSRTLPGVDTPVAAAVAVEDIYPNFSGGQKDWRAIRNFLRWNYLEFGQRLQWVCLLGDASTDYRNYHNRTPGSELTDWIPTNIVTRFPTSLVSPNSIYAPFVTDESIVAFDEPEGNDIADIPDAWIGRLPCNNLITALDLVDYDQTYSETPPEGTWRNNVVWTSDDLRYRGIDPYGTEWKHTAQAEVLAGDYLSESLDLNKIYLLDYPLIGLYKPDARRDLNTALSEGTTMFYYVGHGAAELLADEHFFHADDIANLTNGGRRFMFVAFSCDVGVFANSNTQCMAEQFVLATQGGGIAAIAASWVSTIEQNNRLSNAFYSTLYPEQQVVADVTLGEALIAAKSAMWANGFSSINNARRYNLIGDPALRLPQPVSDMSFDASSADSLLTGRLHSVLVDVESSDLNPGPNTNYSMQAQESSVLEPYVDASSVVRYWRRMGNPVFRGVGSLPEADTVIPFMAPLSLRLGDSGRMRCIVADDESEHAAILRTPVVQVAAQSDDVHGPLIRLAFEGNRVRVRPGDPLTASLQDTSGVNIVASNPSTSVLLEYDRTGIYSNVSDDVVFQPGSYTRAELQTSLPPDLALGDHTVIMSASDMFGNVGTDTLRFTLETVSVAGLRDVTVFPNPTPGACRLICDLSGPMDLQWDIYTVSGRRLRSLQQSYYDAGPAILSWDGRDGEGDEIANGTYLYVLRGNSEEVGHELRNTGQLVIMR